LIIVTECGDIASKVLGGGSRESNIARGELHLNRAVETCQYSMFFAGLFEPDWAKSTMLTLANFI